MSASDSRREFDIVLWGVTGFTGKLVATLFARRYGLRCPNIRIALAGRNRSRLEVVAHLMVDEAIGSSSQVSIREEAKRIREEADQGKPILPLIEVKEITTEAKTLCKRTQVIVSLAGPYIKVSYGIFRDL